MIGCYVPPLFQTLWEPSVNRKVLRALTLVVTTQNNPELDPLAVLHLDNQLYMQSEWYETEIQKMLQPGLVHLLLECYTLFTIFFFCHAPFHCVYPHLFKPPFGSYFDESNCLLIVWEVCSRSHDIVSHICHMASYCLNSEKLFPISDDPYCNPERWFKPGT